MDLYVKNLPSEIDQWSLQEIFEIFGRVTLARVFFNDKENPHTGIGFVSMPDRFQAKASIKGLNRRKIGNKRIKVKKVPS